MREFRLALQLAGIIPPETILADGKIHRCKAEGDHGKKSGAYQMFPDRLGGGYENWREGTGWIKWRSAERDKLNPDEEKRIQSIVIQASRERAAREEMEAKSAKLQADMKWRSAVEGCHPYLSAKGICSNGSRVFGDMLLIPVCDWSGEIQSLQTIDPSGAKKFIHGGRVKGNMYRLGNIGECVYLCEGFATGSTIHSATNGKAVFVAFNCGNLAPVGRVIRNHLPRARIVVCADNDWQTEGNPGIKHARATAEAINGRLVIPPQIAGTDFNDMARIMGFDAVRECLKRSVKSTLYENR